MLDKVDNLPIYLKWSGERKQTEIRVTRSFLISHFEINNSDIEKRLVLQKQKLETLHTYVLK